MPRKPKKSKRIALRGIENWQLFLLAFGPDLTRQQYPEKTVMVITSHTFWQEWWQDFGDRVLALWVSRDKFTRPWGWWEFAAPRWEFIVEGVWSFPDPRSKLGGSGVYRHEIWPACLPGHDFGCYALERVNEKEPPVFESEKDYLERHGL